MRWLVVAVCVAMSMAGSISAAQDNNNPEVLKKELADSLNQLKAAQDRKNELATENEKLRAQLAEMQKEVGEARRAAATWAEQTYSFRSQQAAWQVFLEGYPQLKTQWQVFLETGPVVMLNELPVWQDAAPTTGPSTQPATIPTSSTAK